MKLTSMETKIFILLFALLSYPLFILAQADTMKTDTGSNANSFSRPDRIPKKTFKNVIRYNLSGGLLFGVDRYIVFGYERVIRPRQSISINAGKISLPELVSIDTDSFRLSKDAKSSGFNISVDYRFYLAKENKYAPPHGLYIG